MHASILNSTLSHWNHIVNFSNTSNYVKQKQFLKFCGMFYANDTSFFFFNWQFWTIMYQVANTLKCWSLNIMDFELASAPKNTSST